LTLNFVSTNTSDPLEIDLSQFAVKFQGIKNAAGTSVSYELAGTPCCGPTQVVPAPTGLVALGFGLVGLSAALRKR
jgi:hypothetical protein